jgi:carbamoyl-phosphate synthase large subunit
MRSTGEVMGHASSFGHAFAKAQAAADMILPLSGVVLISVNDFDKSAASRLALDLHRMGFTILATVGTAAYFERIGIPATVVKKVSEGTPNILDLLRDGQIQMIINTPLGGQAHIDGMEIRTAAYRFRVPITTTLSAAAATVQGIRALKQKPLKLRSLQAHYAATK